jgi:hypothetical protein
MTDPRPPALSRRALLRLAITGPLIPQIPPDERATLERVAHSGSGRQAVRAAVVLASNEAQPATQVAATLGVSQLTVLRCAWRYRKRGLEEFLNPLA